MTIDGDLSEVAATPALQQRAFDRGDGWPGSILLGLFLLLAYSINGRHPVSFDTTPTCMLTLTLVRGEGVSLDRFAPLLTRIAGFGVPPFATTSRGHLISRYPVAPALVIAPLVAPQAWLLDWKVPGWDRRNVLLTFNECKLMTRRSLAVLMAAAMVLLHRLLRDLGLRATALPAALACGLGSDVWMIGSQALWQHGPALFCLVAAIYLLGVSSTVSRTRLLLSGLATAILVACRLMDLVFAMTISLYLVRFQPRGLIWFLPCPAIVAAVLIAYNLYFFGSPIGGQAALEQIHRSSHNVQGPWSGDLLNGLLGTLFSPNRGLFAFSPWALVAVLCLPLSTRRLRPHSLIGWLLWSLVPYSLVLSKYSVWWGGHCFGPRYWTEAMPLFAILLALALERVGRFSRVGVAFVWFTIVYSIALQGIGAFCYPSTWNLQPTNIDLDHGRLWDWRDTELSRCLREYPGYHPKF